MAKQAVVYINIPFCPIGHGAQYVPGAIEADSDVKHRYMEALVRECTSSLSLMSDYEIPAIYVGGGAPSVVRPDDVAMVLRCLRDGVHLPLGFELSMEALPQTVGTPSMGGMKQGGVNRVELRMYSANDDELERLGCDFTFQDIDNAWLFMAEFSFRNVSMDVLYGFPGQTKKSFARTLRYITARRPDHVRLEQYSGTETESCPDPQELYEQACLHLADYDYHRYTQDCFAQPRRECRYTTMRLGGCDVIGLGLGAVSLTDDVVCTNTPSLTTYIDCAGISEKAIDKVERLSPEQKQEYLSACQAQLV